MHFYVFWDFKPPRYIPNKVKIMIENFITNILGVKKTLKNIYLGE